jgi:phosphoribosyl-dephospho-CoA transferase
MNMFPNDICSQTTNVCARNKEHASQSIENMYSNGASIFIKFDLMIIL